MSFLSLEFVEITCSQIYWARERETAYVTVLQRLGSCRVGYLHLWGRGTHGAQTVFEAIAGVESSKCRFRLNPDGSGCIVETDVLCCRQWFVSQWFCLQVESQWYVSFFESFEVKGASWNILNSFLKVWNSYQTQTVRLNGGCYFHFWIKREAWPYFLSLSSTLSLQSRSARHR